MGNDYSIERIQRKLEDIQQDLTPIEREGNFRGHTLKKLKDSYKKFVNALSLSTFKLESKQDRSLRSMERLLTKLEYHIDNALKAKNPQEYNDFIKVISKQLDTVHKICEDISKKKDKIKDGKISKEKLTKVQDAANSIERTVKKVHAGVERPKFQKIINKKEVREFIKIRNQIVEQAAITPPLNKYRFKKDFETLNEIIKDMAKTTEQESINFAKEGIYYVHALYRNMVGNQAVPSDILNFDLALKEKKVEGEEKEQQVATEVKRSKVEEPKSLDEEKRMHVIDELSLKRDEFFDQKDELPKKSKENLLEKLESLNNEIIKMEDLELNSEYSKSVKNAEDILYDLDKIVEKGMVIKELSKIRDEFYKKRDKLPKDSKENLLKNLDSLNKIIGEIEKQNSKYIVLEEAAKESIRALYTNTGERIPINLLKKR